MQIEELRHNSVEKLTKQFQHLDIFIADCNGLLRGKRIPTELLAKTFQQGFVMPASLFACDITGDSLEETGLLSRSGDRDYPCQIEKDTLSATPWYPDVLQVFATMYSEDNSSPLALSPRTVLRNIIGKLQQQGLFATIAVELEFYLLRRDSSSNKLLPPFNPRLGYTEQSTQVYYMAELDDYKPIIDDIQTLCARQGVATSGVISEYAPGQFEINLPHSDDPVTACDHALLLKRTVKQVAQQHNLTASFMAKPFSQQSGSGCHIHTSLYNADKHNIFALDTNALHSAIAGLQHSCADSMLLFAPNANSYKRMLPGNFVPINSHWGYNNRTVAFRIPVSDDKNLRIEHRIAGADCNPYLVVGGVLAGMLHGIQNQLQCTPEIQGDASQFQSDKPLPLNWSNAIDKFRNSDWIAQYCGKKFQDLYFTIKNVEYQSFAKDISPQELKLYLDTV